MKVALVSEWLDAWRGGAETSTLQFLHHVMDSGIEVHVFTRSRPSPTPGLHVHAVSGASMSRTRRSMTFAHRVQWMLKRHEFDIVHAISPCPDVDVYQPRGGTVAESIRRNLALLNGDAARRFKRYGNLLNVKQRYMLRLEKQLLGRQGPTIVAISDYVVRQLKEHYGMTNDRIRRIYNAVNPDAAAPEVRASNRERIRKEFGIAPTTLLVLAVAHNFRLKGVRHWLEALAELRRRGVNDLRSLVVGKGDSGYWHRLANRLRVDENLRFIGPSDRVPELFQAADVLVHPTYYDPCSRVVLEAMTAGLVVITTRWDGASEMVENGVNGFVLPDPGDTALLADHVASLCDPSRRRPIQAAARAVAPQVSMSRHAHEMIELYRSLTTC